MDNELPNHDTYAGISRNDKKPFFDSPDEDEELAIYIRELEKIQADGPLSVIIKAGFRANEHFIGCDVAVPPTRWKCFIGRCRRVWREINFRVGVLLHGHECEE